MAFVNEDLSVMSDGELLVNTDIYNDDLYYMSDGEVLPLISENGAAPPVGWSHDLNGIANANIAKVNGITIANIAKINGVS